MNTKNHLDKVLNYFIKHELASSTSQLEFLNNAGNFMYPVEDQMDIFKFYIIENRVDTLQFNSQQNIEKPAIIGKQTSLEHISEKKERSPENITPSLNYIQTLENIDAGKTPTARFASSRKSTEIRTTDNIPNISNAKTAEKEKKNNKSIDQSDKKSQIYQPIITVIDINMINQDSTKFDVNHGNIEHQFSQFKPNIEQNLDNENKDENYPKRVDPKSLKEIMDPLIQTPNVNKSNQENNIVDTSQHTQQKKITQYDKLVESSPEKNNNSSGFPRINLNLSMDEKETEKKEENPQIMNEFQKKANDNEINTNNNQKPEINYNALPLVESIVNVQNDLHNDPDPPSQKSNTITSTESDLKMLEPVNLLNFVNESPKHELKTNPNDFKLNSHRENQKLSGNNIGPKTENNFKTQKKEHENFKIKRISSESSVKSRLRLDKNSGIKDIKMNEPNINQLGMLKSNSNFSKKHLFNVSRSSTKPLKIEIKSRQSKNIPSGDVFSNGNKKMKNEEIQKHEFINHDKTSRSTASSMTKKILPVSKSNNTQSLVDLKKSENKTQNNATDVFTTNDTDYPRKNDGQGSSSKNYWDELNELKKNKSSFEIGVEKQLLFTGNKNVRDNNSNNKLDRPTSISKKNGNTRLKEKYNYSTFKNITNNHKSSNKLEELGSNNSSSALPKIKSINNVKSLIPILGKNQQQNEQIFPLQSSEDYANNANDIAAAMFVGKRSNSPPNIGNIKGLNNTIKKQTAMDKVSSYHDNPYSTFWTKKTLRNQFCVDLKISDKKNNGPAKFRLRKFHPSPNNPKYDQTINFSKETLETDLNHDMKDIENILFMRRFFNN